MSKYGLRCSLSSINFTLPIIEFGGNYIADNINNITFVGCDLNDKKINMGIINNLELENKVFMDYSTKNTIITPFKNHFDPIYIEKNKIYEHNNDNKLKIKFKTELGNIEFISCHNNDNKYNCCINCDFYVPSSKIYCGINNDNDWYGIFKCVINKINFTSCLSGNSTDKINDCTIWGSNNTMSGIKKVTVGCKVDFNNNINTIILKGRDNIYDVGIKCDSANTNMQLGAKYNMNYLYKTNGDIVINFNKLKLTNFESQTQIQMGNKYSLGAFLVAQMNDNKMTSKYDINVDVFKDKDATYTEQTETENI